MPSSEEALSLVHHYKQQYLSIVSPNNFDRDLWDHVIIVSANTDDSETTAKVLYSITIPQTYSNHKRICQGGAVSTVFDGICSSTLAAISKEGFWDGRELTRNLDIKFFRPVPLDEPLNAECEILQTSKALATLRAVITRVSDGTLLASCQQEKYCPGSQAKL